MCRAGKGEVALEVWEGAGRRARGRGGERGWREARGWLERTVGREAMMGVERDEEGVMGRKGIGVRRSRRAARQVCSSSVTFGVSTSSFMRSDPESLLLDWES